MTFISLFLAALITLTPISTMAQEFTNLPSGPKSISLEVIVDDESDFKQRLAISGIVDIKKDLRESYSYLTYETSSIADNNKQIKYSGSLVLDKGNVYTSKESALKLNNDFNGDMYNFAIDDVLEEYKDSHVLLSSYESIRENQSSYLSEADQKAYKSFVNELTNIVKDSKSLDKLVNKNGNIMTIKLDVPSLLSSTEKTLDYLYNNQTPVDKLANSIYLIIENNKDLSEEYIGKEISLQEIKDYLTQLIKDTRDIYGTEYKELIQEENDTSLEIKLTKVNSRLLEIKGKLIYSNYTIDINASIKDVDTYTKRDYSSSKTLDELVNDVEYRHNEINPVGQIIATWNNYNEDTANYVYLKTERTFSGFSESHALFYAIDGRIYLPMRLVCESLGEKVDWDYDMGKAYVERDGSKIYVDGIVREATTYLKVRDFEKLGYIVDYSSLNGTQTATIKTKDFVEKNKI